MRILLVDDSLTIRSLLRRTLGQLAAEEVVEAPNGVEALTQLARRRVDLVILDVNMPLMDGVETLEAIRTAPEYAALPVVMLTSEKNEPLVRRLVELGITAYLSKPLSQELLADRLSKILGRIRQPQRERPPAPVAGRRMLVVEQDPDRRHFFLNAVAGRFETTEADSAAAALQACYATPPPSVDFVLVGHNVGLPPVDMFVAKLRGLPHLGGARLLGCVRRGEAAAAHQRRLFDAVLEASCIPDVFLADVERAVTGTQTPLERMLLVRPTLARDLVCATEQVFGMMLSCEVEALAGDTVRVQRRARAALVHASIGLVAEADTLLTLLFRADTDSARAIAARMIGVPVQEVQEPDVQASAAELSNIVLGRVRNRMVEAGLRAQMQLPRTWTEDEAAASPHDDPQAIRVGFHSAAIDASFELLLSAPAPQAA
jgi:CheY-like chemotaxis protein/CheY-specific phosphatase CheX